MSPAPRAARHHARRPASRGGRHRARRLAPRAEHRGRGRGAASHADLRRGRRPAGRALRAWLICAVVAAAGISHADPDLRLPPGTRTDAQGQRVSGRGIRETSDFLARELARRGISVEQLGPYGARGVVLTRFVSQTASTPWLAIHVLRSGGKTMIFFVPRAKSATHP